MAANSIGTDTDFSKEESQIFQLLEMTLSDYSPDALACRLHVENVTSDSPVSCPWLLTKELSAYVSKFSHVSSTCRLPVADELQLLEVAIVDPSDARFDPKVYTVYEILIVRNRLHYVRSIVSNQPEAMMVNMVRPRQSLDSTAWPLYYDMSALSAQPSDWQDLTVYFSSNAVLSGEIVMQAASQFWAGQEDMSGHALKLGFLFLYGLLTGTITAKVCANDDSRTLASIFLQLYSDRHQPTIMSSIAHILVQNEFLPSLCPKFQDNRQFKSEMINGVPDSLSPTSPLADVFEGVLPVLVSNFDDLWVPQKDVSEASHPMQMEFIMRVPTGVEYCKTWPIPAISDFSCDLQHLRPLPESSCKSAPHLAVSASALEAFCGEPLSGSLRLPDFVSKQTRSQLGYPLVDDKVCLVYHVHKVISDCSAAAV